MNSTYDGKAKYYFVEGRFEKNSGHIRSYVYSMTLLVTSCTVYTSVNNTNVLLHNVFEQIQAQASKFQIQLSVFALICTVGTIDMVSYSIILHDSYILGNMQCYLTKITHPCILQKKH